MLFYFFFFFFPITTTCTIRITGTTRLASITFSLSWTSLYIHLTSSFFFFIIILIITTCITHLIFIIFSVAFVGRGITVRVSLDVF